MPLQLTGDQQAAYDALCQFVLSPTSSTFVLKGYSGTGKSTLMKHFADHYAQLMQTLHLIDPQRGEQPELKFTATTNQAADVLSQAIQRPVQTVHSALSLRVQTDYKTGRSRVVVAPRAEILENTVLVIDEASYIDKHLLNLIGRQTRRCKIILVGDPAQLLNVGCTRSPVFDAGFPEAVLTQIVRQNAGNPIIDFSTQCRETVESGDWFAFTPDGTHIRHLDRERFEDELCAEFTRSDREHHDSRILAWRNKTVIAYNKAIAQLVQGCDEPQIGDLMVCNNFVRNGQGGAIKTDQLVKVTHLEEPCVQHGAPGRYVTLDARHRFFMAESRQAHQQALKQAQANDDWVAMAEIQDSWIDLREAYASTVNKSQGSTFDQVFIDLDDLKRCPSANQLARMLYVGASRARTRVTFTGDLV